MNLSPIAAMNVERAGLSAIADKVIAGATQIGVSSSLNPSGQHHRDYRPAMASPLQNGRVDVSPIYRNQNGLWLSAYAPILAHRGEVGDRRGAVLSCKPHLEVGAEHILRQLEEDIDPRRGVGPATARRQVLALARPTTPEGVCPSRSARSASGVAGTWRAPACGIPRARMAGVDRSVGEACPARSRARRRTGAARTIQLAFQRSR